MQAGGGLQFLTKKRLCKFWDESKMNFQIKFMVILNCTNQEGKVIYVVWSQNNA